MSDNIAKYDVATANKHNTISSSINLYVKTWGKSCVNQSSTILV